MNHILRKLGLLTFTALLVSCGGESSDSNGSTESDSGLDNTQEVQEYYAANPDFFSFKTLQDVPDNLDWDDGADLPDIGSPQAKKGGTEYTSMQDFPRTLRTVGPDANGSFRNYILDWTALQLAHRHPNEYKYYPGLAQQWALDEANKTVYVKLDPDARWSDGEAVTSDDMLFLFFFNRSTYIVAPWYNNFYSTMFTNITKYDDHIFSITMAEARPDMLAMGLEHSPAPEHFYKELGEDFVERYQWRPIPTTGAYVVRDEDIDKGRSIALSRVEDWWAKDKKFWRYRFNTDRIHLSVIRDTEKVFESFKRGDLDIFRLNLAEYWYEKLPDSDPDVQAGYIHKVEFDNQRPRPPYGLYINSGRPLLDDQNVRIGLNYATDWDSVIEKYFRGDFARLNTANDGFGEFSDPTVKARPYDVTKAQEYFAEAGFTKRAPDGILMNNKGQRLSFTVSTGYESLRDVLTILKEQALKAGVEYRLEVLDNTAGWKKVQEKQHDIHFVAFGRFLEEFPRYWEGMHSSNAYDNAFLPDGSVNPDRQFKVQTNNLESIASPEIDALIQEYDTATSRERMKEISHQITSLHDEYASFVPGYYQPFYREAFWRWVQWPEGYNYKHSEMGVALFVHWIDTDIKEETLDARKSGKTFEPQILIYDQFADQ